MQKNKLTIKDMAFIAMMTVMITVCSWITIPGPVPFTLQTFAVFCAVNLLGGKRGTLSVLVFLLLGAAGIPVFSGFKGGIGCLLGSTGGYLFGFLFSALICWGCSALSQNRLWGRISGMVLGLLVCYAVGTWWFIRVYTAGSGPIGVVGALSMCVFPFVLPDAAKLVLAFIVSEAVKKRITL